MKQKEWKRQLEQYFPEKHAKTHIPLKYTYAVKQTEKAILFKFQNHVAVFIPKNVLKCDHSGESNIGKPGWIYIDKRFIKEIIAKYPRKDWEFLYQENCMPRKKMIRKPKFKFNKGQWIRTTYGKLGIIKDRKTRNSETPGGKPTSEKIYYISFYDGYGRREGWESEENLKPARRPHN